MANTMRWRYGDTNPILAPVASETVIEMGDLVYQDTGKALPASAAEDAGTEGDNQEAFHDAFLGVAMQQSRAGDTDPIRIATTGVFEFACPAEARSCGQLVGADENSGGNGLLNQTVDNVATAPLAIGRVAKDNVNTRTTVLVEIVSTIMLGGPQAAA